MRRWLRYGAAMTTPATDPPPVTESPGSNLRGLAAEIDDELTTLARQQDMTSGEVAQMLLNLSRPALLEAMAAGRLSGVIIDGKVHVNPAGLQLAVRAAAQESAAALAATAEQARLALRLYLEDRPVVALWDECRGEERPLVCARRGATHVHYGIEYHSVVLRTQWVAMWAYQRRDVYPELASTPIGAAFDTALLTLPGVQRVQHVTPLADGESHNVRSSMWVRIDPAVWPVQVPELIAHLVDGPQLVEEDR